MPPPIIETVDLSLRYPTQDGFLTALSGVNLRIERGQFVSLIGPSGCGKSTLLSTIGGLLKPTGGQVLFDGAPLTEPSPRIGFAFQDSMLLPWHTVLDNVLLPARIRFGDTTGQHARAVELLKMAGLEGFERNYPKELSGGMRQRVAIARALLLDPEVLLMDEPFGALDAMTRERMGHELLRIWQGSGKTVIFVTHGISESVFLSDRVVVMSSRPGCVARQLPIDLPRPRGLSSQDDPRFGDAARILRGLLIPTQESTP